MKNAAILFVFALMVSDTGAAERKTYRIEGAASEIIIDGELNEEAWKNATRLELNYETRPGENVSPPVKTECRLTYDKSSLYVGCKADDPNPERVRARFTDRDRAFQDDFVGVVLDTFNDERRAFEFFVNPLGVQMDLFFDDVGGNEDDTWDAIWNSAGKVHNGGYTVEFEIPFSSLRFPASPEEQTWGIDILRMYPRTHRYRIGLHPLDRNTSCYLCQASKIIGFEGIAPGKNLEFDPTLTVVGNQERAEFPEGNFQGDSRLDPGLSISWGISPNWTANGTINPDFSQVEADAVQLNVNTEFALFFPEKRPFFLEGADFFNTPLDIVFTRNVADPNLGIKLSGKSGSNAGAFFFARDEITNLILPGSQRSSSASLDQESSDSVIRYRRDMWNNSAVGLLITDRESQDYFNRVAGFDTLLRPGDSDNFRVQLLASSSQYPDSIVTNFNQPAGSFSDYAFQGRYDHNGRDWDFYGQLDSIGRDFRADMGFLPRVDYRFYLGGVNRTFHGDSNNFITQMNIGTDFDQTEDQDGILVEREWEAWIKVNGPLQSFMSFDAGRRKRGFNNQEFMQTFINLFGEFTPSNFFYVNSSALIGDALDVVNTRNGKIFQVFPSAEVKLGKHWWGRVDYLYERLNVLNDQRLYTASISQFEIRYQLNVRTLIRAIIQYTSIDRTPELYTVEVPAESREWFNQFLFSYKINPQTVLFLGYSDNHIGNDTFSLTQLDRTVFFKIGYAWRM